MHSRRDRPMIATGSPTADELGTVYLFLVLSRSQRPSETLRSTRPRRRGLQTVLAPLSSSPALGHRQSFTLSPTPARGRLYEKGKPSCGPRAIFITVPWDLTVTGTPFNESKHLFTITQCHYHTHRAGGPQASYFVNTVIQLLAGVSPCLRCWGLVAKSR